MQIQHAGEGGIYAELIQDRTFSGLAYTQVPPLAIHKGARALSSAALTLRHVTHLTDL